MSTARRSAPDRDGSGCPGSASGAGAPARGHPGREWKQHDEVQTVDVPIDGLVEVADRERDKGWHPIDVAGDLLRGDVHVCDRRASRNGRLKSCWSAK